METHSKKDLDQLLRYISEVRDWMRMQNWSVNLHPVFTDDPDSHAETWQHENHHCLNVRVGERFFQENDRIKQNTVVHELVHAQHRDVNELWHGCINSNDDISRNEARSWDYDFRMFMERFVSWITDMIARHPRCPQWPGTYTKPSEGVRLFDEVP